MMGAGKSAVGRSLAAQSGRPFIDTDLLLQNRLGRPIPQLFQIYGEEAFRDHENAILRNLDATESVISTGGGIVTHAENWKELRRLGTTIYLRATEEALISRLEQSKKRRPLLEVDDWQQRVKDLLAARRHLYETADVIVNLTDEDIDTSAAAILKRLGEGTDAD